MTPPRWSQRLLRTWLPDDGLGDAIVGDLHEEFVRDVASLGDAPARLRYRQRVAGVIGYGIVDAIRWRPWTSGPVVAPAGSSAVTTHTSARPRPALVGRADLGLIAAAFGVLGIGIVGNTMLFSTARHVPSVSPGAGGGALGVVALALAVVSAGVAAVMLCVGPRWLRRRACLEASARRDAATNP